MTATLINGKLISDRLRKRLATRANLLMADGTTPTLAMLCVGTSPADNAYVRNKIRACDQVGIKSVVKELPRKASQWDIETVIEELNNDSNIHGILVQLPLPDDVDMISVLQRIALEKDVDSFHLHNIGALATGSSICPPCTPFAVLSALEEYKIPVRKKNVVVIGASLLLAKAVAVILLNEGATVSVCSAETSDLPFYIGIADILITACGIPGMITGDMIKPGATVIDVALKPGADGSFSGDVDFESVSQTAGYLTPVPGGIGPLNITVLLMNTIQAAEKLGHVDD